VARDLRLTESPKIHGESRTSHRKVNVTNPVRNLPVTRPTKANTSRNRAHTRAMRTTLRKRTSQTSITQSTSVTVSTIPTLLSHQATKKAFPRRTSNPYTYFGEKLSSDLCGPFPKSVEGYRYLLNVVDACTGELWIYLLRKSRTTRRLDVERPAARNLLTHRTNLIPSRKYRRGTGVGAYVTALDDTTQT
jgi:hypothetical protein